MSKIFDAYAQRRGIAATSLRFLMDGERITEDSTPKMLEVRRKRVSTSPPPHLFLPLYLSLSYFLEPCATNVVKNKMHTHSWNIIHTHIRLETYNSSKTMSRSTLFCSKLGDKKGFKNLYSFFFPAFFSHFFSTSQFVHWANHQDRFFPPTSL